MTRCSRNGNHEKRKHSAKLLGKRCNKSQSTKKTITVHFARCRRCTIVVNPYCTTGCVESVTDSWSRRASKIFPDDGLSKDVELHRLKNVGDREPTCVLPRPPSRRHVGLFITMRFVDLSANSQSVCRAWASWWSCTMDIQQPSWQTWRVKSFRISGGTKQRDSLPSLSCHLVWKSSMESDTRSWKEKGFGIQLEDHTKSCA